MSVTLTYQKNIIRVHKITGDMEKIQSRIEENQSHQYCHKGQTAEKKSK